MYAYSKPCADGQLRSRRQIRYRAEMRLSRTELEAQVICRQGQGGWRESSEAFSEPGCFGQGGYGGESSEAF